MSTSLDNKNIFQSTRTLIGSRRVKTSGRPGLGFARTCEAWDTGIHILSGHKRSHTQLMTKVNSAITVGVAAIAGLTINSAVTLDPTAETVDITITAQPDYPRTLRAICNQASVGDGTLAAATGKILKITGTNQFDQVITEWVGLNGTTAVFTINAFKTVTSITYPSRNAASDTCTVTTGGDLALDRPVELAADLLEMEVKASAGTAYAVTTLASTVSVGAAYGKIAGDDTGLLVSASSTVIRLLTTAITGTFPSAPFIAEIISGTQRELVHVSSVGTDGLYTEYTVIRSVHGSTARVWGIGAYFQWVAAMTVSPSITANDRFKFTYLTKAAW